MSQIAVSIFEISAVDEVEFVCDRLFSVGPRVHEQIKINQTSFVVEKVRHLFADKDVGAEYQILIRRHMTDSASDDGQLSHPLAKARGGGWIGSG